MSNGFHPLTQTQIVKSLAKSCEVDIKTARSFLNSLSNVAISEVKKSGVFVLPGIGRLVEWTVKRESVATPLPGQASRSRRKRS